MGGEHEAFHGTQRCRLKDGAAAPLVSNYAPVTGASPET